GHPVLRLPDRVRLAGNSGGATDGPPALRILRCAIRVRHGTWLARPPGDELPQCGDALAPEGTDEHDDPLDKLGTDGAGGAAGRVAGATVRRSGGAGNCGRDDAGDGHRPAALAVPRRLDARGRTD